MLEKYNGQLTNETLYQEGMAESRRKTMRKGKGNLDVVLRSGKRTKVYLNKHEFQSQPTRSGEPEKTSSQGEAKYSQVPKGDNIIWQSAQCFVVYIVIYPKRLYKLEVAFTTMALLLCVFRKISQVLFSPKN